MAVRETHRDIDRAASDWAAREDRGPLSPDEEAALEAWLRGDSRRPGALMRARAMTLMSESARALGPDFNPDTFAEPRRLRLSRRGILTWSGAGLAVVSLGALGAATSALGAVIGTERGEIRLAPLRDGSTVLLNTESRVRVRYDDDLRQVTLLKGEAYFSIARDERRPFVVEVNGRRLGAAQASFCVRKLDNDPVDLLVSQGRVDVAPAPLLGAPRTVVVGANTRLALADIAHRHPETPQPITPETVTRELAWRDGKLSFEGESLAQAALTFARYSDTRIEIQDQALAREPVTGLFAASDPLGFCRAVAHVFDADLRRNGDTIVLSRASPSSASTQ